MNVFSPDDSLGPIEKLELLESSLSVDEASQRHETASDLETDHLESWKSRLFERARAWCRQWDVDLLTENEAEIDDLYAVIEDILDQERKKMGEAIHDEISSPLFGLSMWLRALVREARSNDGEVDVEELEEVQAQLSNLKEITRQLSHEVHRNTRGHDDDVCTAVKRVVRQAEAPGDVSISLSIPQDSPDLSHRAVHHLKLIAQEALYNALQHAGASEIRLQLKEVYEAVQLTITDDGTGFSPDREQGYGIANMRHRAALIGGEFEIKSGSDGTRVRCRCPLPDE